MDFGPSINLNLYIGGAISATVCRKFWIADLTLSAIVCRTEVPDVMSRSHRHIWYADGRIELLPDEEGGTTG